MRQEGQSFLAFLFDADVLFFSSTLVCLVMQDSSNNKLTFKDEKKSN